MHVKKRILLKVSWEALLWENNFWFDKKHVDNIAQEIVNLSNDWFQVAVVCWAWNIWRFKDNQELWIDRVKSDTLWMIWTFMNSVVLSEKVNELWIESIIYSSHIISVTDLAKKFNPIEARKDLQRWKVVFCAWWTWSPFFTTDSAAALRASELNCSVVLKATKVDGVYDKDPMKDSTAIKFSKITFEEAIEKDLKIMDTTAFALCRESWINVMVFNMNHEWNILKAAKWDLSIWTLVYHNDKDDHEWFYWVV